MRLSSLLPAVAAVVILTAPAPAADASVVPGRVLVRYRGDTTHHARVSALLQTGTATVGTLPGDTRVLRITDGDSVEDTVAELRADPSVAYAVPDYRVHAAGFVPNDPGRSGRRGGWRRMQWNFTGPNGVRAPDAWTIAKKRHVPGGRGVIVAVIDSGVAYENYKRFRRAPDLAVTRFVRGYDWVQNDRHPNDQESHGTHVTGTIAQKTNNRRGLTGVAYGAKIMPLRVLDSNGNGVGSDIARAIRYAVRHHARVINMSVEFDTTERARNIPDVIAALRYATRHGVVLVAASGNEGTSRVAYPARASEVISVGATTADGCLADYSNAGRGLDLVAPGGGADAPLDGNAYDRAHCDPSGGDRRIFQQTFTSGVRRFGLVGFEGTSFATPHVTGAVALLLATRRLGRHPSPSAVRRRLKDTAHDIGPRGTDARYGAGLLDIRAALGP
jgi:serine protease